MIPYLTWRNYIVQNAVAISATCGVVIALFSTMYNLSATGVSDNFPEYTVGYIYVHAFIGIVLTSIPISQVGANVAHKLSPPLLKRLFAVLLICSLLGNMVEI